jgi:hypothetical protein
MEKAKKIVSAWKRFYVHLTIIGMYVLSLFVVIEWASVAYAFVAATSSANVSIASAQVSGDISSGMQLDISNLYYKDSAGREISYDFSSGTISGNQIIFPNSAILHRPPSEVGAIYVWEYVGNGALSLSLNTTEKVCTLRTNSDGTAAIGASGDGGVPGINWQFTVSLTNFLFADMDGGYGFSVGGGSSSPAISPSIDAGWFTGWHDGTHYDKVFHISAIIEDDFNNNSWSSQTLLLYGIDPTTTVADFNIEVQNGHLFIASYRINSGQWVEIGRHSISSGSMISFDDVLPYVSIYASTESPTNTYALAVTKSGTGSGIVTSLPIGIDCGSVCSAQYNQGTVVTLTPVPNTDSVFTGWSGSDCSGTGNCSITMNADATVAASFTAQASCTYVISPTTKSFKSTGGNLSIKVTGTGQNCSAPPVNISDAWLSQSGAMSWKNNTGKVKITVQNNTSSQNRTGVIWIGGNALTIEESGAQCQLTSVKSSYKNFTNAGGAGSLDVVVSPQDCVWNVATASNWIHLDASVGTGNRNVVFHVDTNTTGKDRTGKIDVSLATNVKKKKSFSLKQNK